MPASVVRELRAVWRLIQVVWLVIFGIVMVRFRFPAWHPDRRRARKQAWSRELLEALGVTFETNGAELPASALIVSNHISWLDVFVMNAIMPTTFVCKDEVKSWPAIGALVEYSGTLFIERGSRTAAARSAQAMAARMQAGERVAIYPEGTTTQGSTMLPFRAALFQAAIDAQAPVQPASLRYRDAAGKLSTAPAYDGDLSFGESMLNIVRASGIRAEIRFLAPITSSTSRRELARLSEQLIAADLGLRLDTNEQALDGDANASEENAGLASEEASVA